MDRTTRHDGLAEQIRGLTRVIRLVRQRRTDERPAVPLGMVGTLTQIDEIGHQVTGCHAKELAARAALNQSTVSRAVASLVDLGLVERRTDPNDRRASVLALTDAGRAALADARGWYGDLLARALDDWRPEEVEAFTSMLGRFVTDLGALVTRLPEPMTAHDNLEVAR